MKNNPIGTDDVPTQVKNPKLVEQRRMQIVDAAVPLFIENGFHKTTTRQIAKAAKVSVGSMYEYVASKEDILYLACLSIHNHVEQGVTSAISKTTSGREMLKEVIREYFMVCDRMNDQILLMYQVTQSLPQQWQNKVLENDIRISNLIIDALNRAMNEGGIPKLSEKTCDMVAQNITVLGHMWTFRRWHFARSYSIDEYIDLQTRFILGLLAESP
ncbi:TetR/AcrR family transcriptional regulator [bacterium]|nr:TetR/AcrR family transcriptional regulator [bacterium]